jgi:hypothetical protein
MEQTFACRFRPAQIFGLAMRTGVTRPHIRLTAVSTILDMQLAIGECSAEIGNYDRSFHRLAPPVRAFEQQNLGVHVTAARTADDGALAIFDLPFCGCAVQQLTDTLDK